MSKELKIRQSNFEILRIITIIIIIMHHFVVHSGFTMSEVNERSNVIWLLLCKQGGMIGNNIFPLISGYFLSNNKNIEYKKLIRLWGTIVFYSLGVYILFVIFNLIPFSAKDAIRACLPVTYKSWWFATIYFYLFLLSPFLNIIIFNINRIIYIRLIIVSFVVLCFIPTITGLQGECNDLVWFVFLYFVGGYIVREKDLLKGKWIYLLGAIFGCISIVLVNIIPTFLSNYKNSLYKYQYVPAFTISVLIVIFTAKCRIIYCRIINTISSATLGVYLIHENEYIREMIWNIADVKLYINDNFIYLFFYTSLICILIFFICTVIELVRMRLVYNMMNICKFCLKRSKGE